MNANELADYLENDFQIQEAVIDMLRQLQAENDELRKTVDLLFAGMESSLNLNKAQNERK